MSELAAEQSHLAYARTQLARMRERTSRLDGAGAADWVSREYLESALALRMKQLADDPALRQSMGLAARARASRNILQGLALRWEEVLTGCRSVSPSRRTTCSPTSRRA